MSSEELVNKFKKLVMKVNFEFLENKLFGKKYSHFIPCIVTTHDLELPKQLAKKLTSITV